MKAQSLTKKFMLLLVCFAMLFAISLLAGCSGDDGAAGAPGADGTDLTAALKLEACAGCHDGQGAAHQASYNELYQDGVMQVANLAYSFVTPTVTLTFNMTKSSANFDCTQADTIGSYFAGYDGATATFPSDVSIIGTLTYDAGTNLCTSTKGLTSANATIFADQIAAGNGLITLYGTDEVVNKPGHMQWGKYPFAALLKIGTVDYASTANVAGCEKCHTRPFLKHAYIYGEVNGDSTTQFYECKGCHYDTRNGSDTGWQLLADNPAAFASGATTTAPYAYKAKLMNDVHMSHAMEFGYPQSMANCATCHEGKLTSILTDTNFTLTTCKSCHPVTGPAVAADAEAGRAPALRTLMTGTNKAGTAKITAHDGFIDNLYADAATPPETCTDCHLNSGTKGFADLHTGYNSMIYNAAGQKYADNITAVISSVTLTNSNNTLDIKFSVTDSLATGFTVTPTVQVSFYGYDTKDFILSNHTSDANNKRMEKTIGTANTLFTEVATGVPNSWEVMLDMSAYASTPTIAEMIAAGTIKRAEIAVLPAMKDADGVTLGLNAPSKTFDMATKKIVTYYAPIVDVAKCNSCHDQLATTFHSGNRGGNVTVCRMCHVPTSGGSHLEMQSRSIDSYVHAIHSFQPFDPGDIDFTNPVEALRYEHKIESEFPTFGITNCEACHNTGTYEVPSQSKSLPGKHSAADTYNVTRNIGAVPAYVTGPASRACGGCHRAKLINEDAAGGLAAFNEHVKTNGYLLEDATGLLDTVIESIMSIFK